MPSGLSITIDVDDAAARGKLRDLDAATDKIGTTATTMGGAVEKTLARVSSSTFETQKSATELHRALLEAFENPMAAMKAFGQSLVSDVLESLGPTGVAAGVATGALAGMGLVMFELAHQATSLGAALNDQRDKTGISVEALSTLKVAAEIAGGSLDEITNAIFMMQRRMAEDPTGFEDGLRRIGVSLKSIQDLTPDQQFLRLTDALRNTADASQRNAAGAEIFSRQFRDLAAVLAKDLPGLIDLSKQMGATWSDQDAKAAEELEMKTRALHAQWSIFTTNIGKTFIPALTDLVEWFNRAANPGAGSKPTGFAVDPKANQLQTQWQQMASAGRDVQGVLDGLSITIGETSKATAEAVLKNKAYNDEVEKLTTAHAALDETTKTRILHLLALNDSESQIARIVGVSENAVKALAEAQKKGALETQKWYEAQAALLPILASPEWDGTVESMLRLGGSVEHVAIYMGAMKGTVDAAKLSIDSLKKADEDWRHIHIETMKVSKESDDAFAKARAELLKAVNQSLADALSTQLEYQKKTMALGGDQLALEWADALNKLGPPMVGFEDQWKRSVDAIDAYFETKMSDRALQREAQAWGREIANSFQTGFQGILEGFPDLIAQSLTGGGGVGGALQAGTSQIGSLIGKKMFGVESPLNATIANGVSHLFGDSVAGGLSAALPGIGSAIGSLVGPALNALMNIGGPSKDELAARSTFGDFQKQFGSLQQTIEAVGAAYAKAGKTGVDAQRDLQRALDATHQSAQAEAAALATINGVLNQQKQDEADLKSAVDRYKFSIEELGPAMQKQQLDDQAKQLINDWRLLVGSGISLTTVNEHMASSMNDYLKLARATGQEIPQAMKPILQKMIEQGDLTDDAGNKITELKGIGVDFSQTMTEGFKSVVDKLQELLDKIGLVPAAIAQIPTSIDVSANVSWNVPAPPDMSGFLAGDQYPGYGSHGGYVTPAGIQYLASGNVVQPMAWRARGTDTVPAMLTPGEGVLNRSAMRRLGANGLRALNNGGGSGGDVYLTVNVAGSVRSDRELTDVVKKELKGELDRRRRAS